MRNELNALVFIFNVALADRTLSALLGVCVCVCVGLTGVIDTFE